MLENKISPKKTIYWKREKNKYYLFKKVQFYFYNKEVVDLKKVFYYKAKNYLFYPYYTYYYKKYITYKLNKFLKPIINQTGLQLFYRNKINNKHLYLYKKYIREFGSITINYTKNYNFCKNILYWLIFKKFIKKIKFLPKWRVYKTYIRNRNYNLRIIFLKQKKYQKINISTIKFSDYNLS